MPPHFRILSQTVYARTAQKVNHMKLLVLSDTHRSLGFAYEAIETESPDAVAHLGDHLSDAEDLSFAFQEPEFFYVPGNCDYEPAARQSLLLELAGVRIFLTHGHLFGVKSGLDTLAAAAKDMGAQLALFGHTHRRCWRTERRHAPEPRRGGPLRPQRLCGRGAGKREIFLPIEI